MTYSNLGKQVTSNLSKIKPKLRTTGNVTGNFGRPKSRAGSNLNQIGLTDKVNITVTRQSDYIQRMYDLINTTNDDKMKRFAINEINTYRRRRIT